MYTIGLDVGGTNIAGAIVSGDAQMLIKGSVPYPGADTPNESVERMAQLIYSLLSHAKIEIDEIDSIGLAVPGSIDYENDLVIHAYNLGYHSFPLVALLGKHFPNTPIHIENDANAAALAEYYDGAFKGYSSGVLITLGTGVGGGAIMQNRLFIGGRKSGFELGHIIIAHDGEPCTCGNNGCFEACCSATALIREGEKIAKAVPNCMIAHQAELNDGVIDAKLVIDCARAGDPYAVQIFDRYIAYLGSAIVSIANTFDPEVIAIGGGVCNAGEFLFHPLRAYVQPRAFFESTGAIVPAQMGNDAGIIGAAMIGRNRS